MVNVQVRTIQGDAKGQVAKTQAEIAIQLFFEFGVKRIQDECNKVAARYKENWGQKDPQLYMFEYGLPKTTYDDGLKELDLTFRTLRASQHITRYS